MNFHVFKGISECSSILGKNTNFVVYYDPDVDGVIAGSMSQRILAKCGFSSRYYINSDRQHGFKMSDSKVSKLKGSTLIAVDFSMSRNELKALTDRGVDVICIDHHEITDKELVYVKSEETGCEGVLINNQYCFEPDGWRFLSGAGMVYSVFKYIVPQVLTETDVALVGLSLLSDVRVIENDRAKYFLHTLYTCKSSFMQYLLNVTKPVTDYGFGELVIDRNYVDYTLNPKINSLFRLNKGDDAISIFKQKYPVDNDLEVFRQIQKMLTNKVIELSSGSNILEGLELKHISVLCLEVTSEFGINNPANFVGIACSKVKNDTSKTSIVLYVERTKDGIVVKRGSARGLLDSVDYLGILKSFGIASAGHSNAFGILKTNLKDIDLVELENRIHLDEKRNYPKEYSGRILEVQNLNLFTHSKNVEIGEYNNYVRDSKRILIKYTGSQIKRVDKKKMTEFILDDIVVKCFDQDLTVETGLIQAVSERGYIQFYLKRPCIVI